MLRPIKNQIVLSYLAPAPEGRIVIPENSQKRSTIMQVEAAGPQAPKELQPGVKVSVLEYGGSLVKHDGRELRVVHGDDVLAVLA